MDSMDHKQKYYYTSVFCFVCCSVCFCLVLNIDLIPFSTVNKTNNRISNLSQPCWCRNLKPDILETTFTVIDIKTGNIILLVGATSG